MNPEYLNVNLNPRENLNEITRGFECPCNMILACLLYDCDFNWWFLRLNSWADCVAISTDIASYGSNSVFWFTRKILDLLILKLILFLLNCLRNLP